jgi:uncharacterized Ntn-hydrolase superfamily protein
MTCSIVAVDSRTGEVGFAIASCCWDAGQVCLAVPGYGAIASQAQGNMRFLPVFAEQVIGGMPCHEIMRGFRSMDDAIENRQVGMATLGGEGLAHTGRNCSYWAGHITGEGFSCQGNTLVGENVVQDMAGAFRTTSGTLVERLYAALKAADAAGGDARGRQSARLLVSRRGEQGPPAIDFRIEDHDYPVAELGRVLAVGGDLRAILRLLARFAAAPDQDKGAVLDDLHTLLAAHRQPRYLDWWEELANGYLTIGEMDKALAAYRAYLAINPGMARIMAANARSGLFPMTIARALGLIAE